MESISNTDTKTIICKNCCSDKVAEYCSHCGQRTLSKRFTLRSFFTFLLSAFNLEKGFFYTMKMLFIDPGKVINEYLGGRTKIYYNPLNYILLITGLSALLMIWFGIFDANIANTNELMGIKQDHRSLMLQSKMIGIIKQYINVISMIIIPFISLVSMWVYTKRKLFYGEFLIFNCFVQAQIAAIGVVFFPVYVIIPGMLNNIMPVGYLITIVYYSYALRKTFKSSILKSVINAVVINIIGMLLFMLALIVLMIIFIIAFKLFGGNLKELLNVS